VFLSANQKHFMRNFAFTMAIPIFFTIIWGLLYVYSRLEIFANVPMRSYNCTGFMPLFCQQSTPGGNLLGTYSLLAFIASYNSPLVIPMRNIILGTNNGLIIILGGVLGFGFYGLIIDGVRYCVRTFHQTTKKK